MAKGWDHDPPAKVKLVPFGILMVASGASKWNPVEHRLFGPISVNWAGQPLRCLNTMLGYIRGTVTSTGLGVTAKLLERTYRTQIRVTKQEMETVRVIWHKEWPNWNDTIPELHDQAPEGQRLVTKNHPLNMRTGSWTPPLDRGDSGPAARGRRHPPRKLVY